MPYSLKALPLILPLKLFWWYSTLIFCTTLFVRSSANLSYCDWTMSIRNTSKFSKLILKTPIVMASKKHLWDLICRKPRKCSFKISLQSLHTKCTSVSGFRFRTFKLKIRKILSCFKYLWEAELVQWNVDKLFRKKWSFIL